MISNQYSDCDQQSTITLDRSTGFIKVTFDIGAFSSSTKCSSTVVPESMGYSSTRNGPEFSIKYNINSLMTAFAANSGIVPMDLLTHTNNWKFPNTLITFGNDVYKIVTKVYCYYIYYHLFIIII